MPLTAPNVSKATLLPQAHWKLLLQKKKLDPKEFGSKNFSLFSHYLGCGRAVRITVEK